jgi:hypothetical protein
MRSASSIGKVEFKDVLRSSLAFGSAPSQYVLEPREKRHTSKVTTDVRLCFVGGLGFATCLGHIAVSFDELQHGQIAL